MHKNVLSHLARHPPDRLVSKAIVMNPIISFFQNVFCRFTMLCVLLSFFHVLSSLWSDQKATTVTWRRDKRKSHTHSNVTHWWCCVLEYLCRSPFLIPNGSWPQIFENSQVIRCGKLGRGYDSIVFCLLAPHRFYYCYSKNSFIFVFSEIKMFACWPHEVFSAMS